MNEDNVRERALADCLEDYHRRRALGERPKAEDYKDRADVPYDEFLDLLAAESAFDVALAPEAVEAFPRPMGPYTLLRELGRGAVGVVYEAVHRELGRKVALKVLRTGFDTDETARERFRREARACAQVRHPHIVEIYEVGEHERQPYYSMTLVDGESLHDLRKRRGALRAADLFEAIADVAGALAALHKAGIVHRDVKPSNIMVDAHGHFMLADFGLARTAASERLTQTGQALGTPMYMSPEQVLGQTKEIDGRSDVYGLGASLYEALAGRALFIAREPMAVMRMILKERPEPLCEVSPAVPRDASNVVMKALEKRKEDRYQTALAMRADLLAFARGEYVAGKPVGTAVRVLRKAGRRWRLGIAAAAVLAVGAYAYQNRPAELVVTTYPVAQVVIDHEDLGLSTVSKSLSPGEHTIKLRSEGFEPREETVELEAGQTLDLRLGLYSMDPDDPKALERLSEQLGIMVKAHRLERTRAAPAEALVVPMLPRGRVRVADLQAYRVDVNDELPPGGTIRYFRGDELLLSQPFEPVIPVTVAEIDSALLDRLHDGDVITWGYYPAEGEPVTTTCTVADHEVTERARWHAEGLVGAHPVAQRHVLAQYFLDERLYTAAFRTASAAAAERPESERAWAVMLEALREMELELTLLNVETLRGLDAVPDSERGRAIERR
jgi:predicted Ser/Thr protein kinase